jgi:hypothetical protein
VIAITPLSGKQDEASEFQASVPPSGKPFLAEIDAVSGL